MLRSIWQVKMLWMKSKLHINSFFLFLILSHSLCAEAKVTYGFSEGRLGDNLISYLHAKWVSYLYQIPLSYIPFDGSDNFLLHELEKPFGSGEKTVTLNDLSQLDWFKDVVYKIPYAPDYLQEYEHIRGLKNICPYIKVDWEDKTFIEWARPFLSPRTPVKTLCLPTDKITVALHIRRHVGVDRDPRLATFYPYKFLPNQFYIDQIRWIYKEFNEQPLYIYFFSNDPDMEKVAEFYKKTLNIDNITFDWGKENSVLTDFYSMMQFDCLVRPQSNLSIVASKFGRQKLVISPEHVKTGRRGNVVDKVLIEKRW